MDDPQLDPSDEAQYGVHEAISRIYTLIGRCNRQFAPQAITELVEPKPTGLGPDFFVVRAVLRDFPIAALINKAAMTKAAVVSLVRNKFDGDAFALCRVLLENMLVLDWLLPENKELRDTRIDAYVLHFETFKVRSDEVNRKHSPDRPHEDLADESAREIAKHVFGNEWRHLAQPAGVGRKGSKLTVRHLAEEARFTAFYEREYFEMSTFVHSAPASVWWDLEGANHFQIRRAEHPNLARRAVGLSNLYMLHMLSLVDSRFELGLSELVQAAQALMLRVPAEDREQIMAIFRGIESPEEPLA